MSAPETKIDVKVQLQTPIKLDPIPLIDGVTRKGFFPKDDLDYVKVEGKLVGLDGTTRLRPPVGRGELVTAVKLGRVNEEVVFTASYKGTEVVVKRFPVTKIPEGVDFYMEHEDTGKKLSKGVYKASLAPTLRTEASSRDLPLWYDLSKDKTSDEFPRKKFYAGEGYRN